MPADQPAGGAHSVLEPVTRALRGRFPEARFSYREAPDGLRCYLDVATDCDDDFAVLETVAAATLDLLFERGVVVHVFPFRRLPDDERTPSADSR